MASNFTQKLNAQIEKIRVYRRGEERAAHKPLLLLLALANVRILRKRLVSYSEIEPKLVRLLREFGPTRKTSPIDPFWRLTKDGLWVIPEKGNISVDRSGRPSRKVLLKDEVQGGFPQEVFDHLINNPKEVDQIVGQILEKNFPESYHQPILDELGFEFVNEQATETVLRKKRDPEFRKKIMTIYGNRCAVCGFDIKMGINPVCIEAAHIKWHQFNGPAIEQNGMALCSIHHKLFDFGAFSLNNEMQIMVSELANGNAGLEDWLLKFAGKRISLPRRDSFLPDQKFVQWHVKEVFKQYS